MAFEQTNRTIITSDSGNMTHVFKNERMSDAFVESTTPASILEYSPNNRFLFVCDSSTIRLFDMSYDTPLDIMPNTSIVADATVQNIEFNADSTKCCIMTSASTRVYDTTTWLQDCLVYDAGVYGGAFSPDGLHVVYLTDIAPYIYSVQLSPGSVAPITTLPTPDIPQVTSATVASKIRGIVYTADSAQMFFLFGGGYNANTGTAIGCNIINVNTGLIDKTVLNTSANSNGGLSKPKLSPDGTKIAFGLSHLDLGIVEVSTGVVTWVDYPVRYAYQSNWRVIYVAWWGNDDIIACGRQCIPAVQIYNIPTDTWPTKYDMTASCTNFGISKPYYAYEVNGTIVESLLVSNWRCSAYSIADGQLVGSVDVTGSTFSIPVPTDDQVMVVVHPVPATRWRSDRMYVTGQQVYPTDANATPFYYVCVNPGTTSSTEPTWGTTIGGQTADGTVVWELVERVAQPVAQMPLSPTPI